MRSWIKGSGSKALGLGVTVDSKKLDYGLGSIDAGFPSPKAPCSFMVDTWALTGLPYHDFGVYVYAMKLHGAFGFSRLWVGGRSYL